MVSAFVVQNVLIISYEYLDKSSGIKILLPEQVIK